MSPLAKLLLLLALSHFEVQCRLLPRITSFSEELTLLDKRIILSASQDLVTENESFLYVTCESQEKTFKENRCNVTVETPAFGNSTYKETCSFRLAPDNLKLESLAKLKLHPFNDDKALLSWLVKDPDYHTKTARVRILQMSTCRFVDIPIPAIEIHSLVPYETTFDVILNNKTFCGSENCRVTYDALGKKVSGPTQFLSNIKFYRLSAIVPAVPRLPIKGFYALLLSETSKYSVMQIGSDGKVTEVLKINNYDKIKLSNAHDYLGVCWTSERTNVTCKQYDARMSPKLNVVLEFHDEPGFGPVRWLQPHNLKESGLVLVTGQATGKENQRFESFSIIRVHPDGRHDRPLEVRGLDFQCTSLHQFYVNVSENDEDELCIHFVCNRGDFDQQGIRNSLKFSTKCLPKKYVSMVKHQASVLN